MDTEKLRFTFCSSLKIGRGVYVVQDCLLSSCKTLRVLKKEGLTCPEFKIDSFRSESSSLSFREARIRLAFDFRKLEVGDLVYIDFNHGYFEVVLRYGSKSNALLITERCNHRCIMCSQPPQDTDELDWRDKFDFIADAMPIGLESFCITGGEPSLYLDDLISPINKLLERNLSLVTILSNGALVSRRRAREFACQVNPSQVLWCIPLYSHNPSVHDLIVGSKGAWFRTIEGMLNLHEEGFPIQIRFIPLAQNQGDLFELARFATSSLSFAQQFVLMGLEVTGYAADNLEQIKPNYTIVKSQLEQIDRLVVGRKMRFNIFNIPLCNLPESLWKYSVQSISDWKNAFAEPCSACEVKSSCAGFFTTSEVNLFEINPVSFG